MNGFGSLNGNLLQPQLTTLNEVPMDGIDLIVNKINKLLYKNKALKIIFS